MRISVIGTGYVGAITGACFAELGNEVVFVDKDLSKIETISRGESPIYEPGLEDLLKKNLDRISATSDTASAVLDTDVTFICVGTPSREDGSIDLRFIEDVSDEVGAALTDKRGHVVVMKSTVLSGTTGGVVKGRLEAASGKRAHADFGLASNPEFLREGSAVHDVFHPDRIVLGIEDEMAKGVLDSLYSTYDCPKLITEIAVAEMIKYVSNAFLATKIGFANEIGNLCKKMGIDTAEVFAGVGMDARINPSFFRSGIGFGGSCFPKDVQALMAQARGMGLEPRILEAVMTGNETQPLRTVELLKKHLPELKGKRIGVLGLAFKPDTDDIRDSRALPIINALIAEGAEVMAYDPLAADNFRKVLPSIGYAENAEDVLDADAVIIATEWREFEDLDFSGLVVVDGRRIKAAATARIYEGVCW